MLEMIEISADERSVPFPAVRSMFPRNQQKERPMASLGRKVFTGKSGAAYRFRVFPLGTRFRKISGVYVVASRLHGANGGRQLVPLYVGHTEDFSQPFDRHHKARDFAEQGANCICVQSDAVEESRVAKEKDLVSSLRPVCND
jgi:hypothetical protein